MMSKNLQLNWLVLQLDSLDYVTVYERMHKSAIASQYCTHLALIVNSLLFEMFDISFA